VRAAADLCEDLAADLLKLLDLGRDLEVEQRGALAALFLDDHALLDGDGAEQGTTALGGRSGGGGRGRGGSGGVGGRGWGGRWGEGRRLEAAGLLHGLTLERAPVDALGELGEGGLADEEWAVDAHVDGRVHLERELHVLARSGVQVEALRQLLREHLAEGLEHRG